MGKMFKNRKSASRGITLIALVITITAGHLVLHGEH